MQYRGLRPIESLHRYKAQHETNSTIRPLRREVRDGKDHMHPLFAEEPLLRSLSQYRDCLSISHPLP